ncbi:Formate acetyltransferase 2 [Pelomyxa schiedti]|nr:Formate acetyltransferase 2 [Pelomyxa schiedti]
MATTTAESTMATAATPPAADLSFEALRQELRALETRTVPLKDPTSEAWAWYHTAVCVVSRLDECLTPPLPPRALLISQLSEYPDDKLSDGDYARNLCYSLAAYLLLKQGRKKFFQARDKVTVSLAKLQVSALRSKGQTEPMDQQSSDLKIYQGLVTLALVLTFPPIDSTGVDFHSDEVCRNLIPTPKECLSSFAKYNVSEVKVRTEEFSQHHQVVEKQFSLVPFSYDVWSQYCIARAQMHMIMYTPYEQPKVKCATCHPWQQMQRGLLYFDPVCTFVVTLKYPNIANSVKRQFLSDIAHSVWRKVEKLNSISDRRIADFVCGMSLGMFLQENILNKPKGAYIEKPFLMPAGTISTRPDTAEPVIKFIDTDEDMFFSLRGADKLCATKLLEALERAKEETLDFLVKHNAVPPGMRSKAVIENVKEGVATKNKNLVLGENFLDGLNNPRDPVSLSRLVLINEPYSDCFGGTFCLTQGFQINWTRIFALMKIREAVLGDMIGRKENTNSLIDDPNNDTSHMKKGRVINEFGHVLTMLRQSITWGATSAAIPPEMQDRKFEDGAYIISFANSFGVFQRILESLAKSESSSKMHDSNLMRAVKPLFGGLWYIPNQEQLGIKSVITHRDFPPIEKHYDIHRLRLTENTDYLANPYFFYNDFQYMHRMSKKLFFRHEGKATVKDPCQTEAPFSPGVPSEKVLDLMGNIFQEWNSTWYKTRFTPLLSPLSAYRGETVSSLSIARRKGMAIKETLGMQMVGEYGIMAHQFRLSSREFVVGNIPHLPAIPMGKVVIEYLTDSERNQFATRNLDETSASGHIVPSHKMHLKKGWEGLRRQHLHLAQQSSLKQDERDFHRSVVDSLEGIQLYALAHARLAIFQIMSSRAKTNDPVTVKNLLLIAERVSRLVLETPKTLLDASQSVFFVHVCLMLQGDPCSLGRLDQVLLPFYQAYPSGAQDIICSLWMKIGEPVLLDRRRVQTTHRSYGGVAVPYTSGPFPGGISVNQWVQQVTLGGYLKKKQVDGCNPLTVLMLRASRMLPLVAPCLSLRLTQEVEGNHMQQLCLKEAAKCLLSGGANPLLFNDDKIVPALKDAAVKSGLSTFPDSAARNYCCDGCYEPVFEGETELAFVYESLLGPLEWTLNRGSSIQRAGAFNLDGETVSFKTPDPDSFETFDEFKRCYAHHFKLLCIRKLQFIMGGLGNLKDVCPSPLLSAFIAGCQNSHRDLTNGGAKYHIVMVFWAAFANTVDSLYSVYKLCYADPLNKIRTSELLHCLIGNWGEGTLPPPFFPYEGFEQNEMALKKERERLSNLREIVLSLPKFGQTLSPAKQELNDIAVWLSNVVINTFNEASKEPCILALREEKKTKYNVDFIFHAGTGSNENYVGLAKVQAASPDGRLSGHPWASNCSPQGWPFDKPIERFAKTVKPTPANVVLQAYNYIANFPDGSEAILRIAESFKISDLLNIMKLFRLGWGPNMLSFNCCDLKTMLSPLDSKAPAFEQYNLVRLRHGGWSDYYVVMHNEIQMHQQRRLQIGPCARDFSDSAAALPQLNPPEAHLTEPAGELPQLAVTTPEAGLMAEPMTMARRAPVGLQYTVFVGALLKTWVKKSGNGPHLHLSLSQGWDCAINLQSFDKSNNWTVVYDDYLQSGVKEAASVVEVLQAVEKQCDEDGVWAKRLTEKTNRLDYFRGMCDDSDGLYQAFNWADMKSTAPTAMGSQITRALEGLGADPRIWLFGQPYSSNNGIHDIHMNQGNASGNWDKDNGTFQDGCIFARGNDDSKWVAVFCAFNVQRLPTDENGRPTADAKTIPDFINDQTNPNNDSGHNDGDDNEEERPTPPHRNPHNRRSHHH